MLTLEHEVEKHFKINIPLKMTPEEEVQFQQSTICWLCENPLGDTQSARSFASGDECRDQENTEEQPKIGVI